MKVYITGCRGQLGFDLLDVLKGKHELAGGDLPELDIADPALLLPALDAFRPEVIINAAAFTKVDACETERTAAMRANAEGPRLLAQYAEQHGAFLVHVSTDYVLDGQRPVPQPYVETDPASPMSYYGVTKLEGEKAVAAATARFAILRTAWLYGIHGHNFLKTMLRLSLQGKPLKVVNDQHGSPTWSWRLARQIDKVIDHGARGVYHATAEGHCTWFELARHFLERMGVPYKLSPCGTEEYPLPARRPANSILENAALKKAGLNVMAPWAEDVDEFVRLHRDRLLDEAGRAR